ncbi:MAG: hypothetical protein EZS28_040278, partial [Streblomastix strix]
MTLTLGAWGVFALVRLLWFPFKELAA